MIHPLFDWNTLQRKSNIFEYENWTVYVLLPEIPLEKV